MKVKFPLIMLQHFSKAELRQQGSCLKSRLEVPFALLYQSRNEDEESFTLTAHYTIQIKTPMPTGKVTQDSKTLEN